MYKRFKQVSVLLCLCLIATLIPGCERQGTTQTIAPADGGSINFEGVKLDIPPGAISEEVEVKIRPVKKPPPLFEDIPLEEKLAMSSIYPTVGPTYDIDIGNINLNKPATLSFRYSDSDIPEGFTEDELFISQFRDGEWYLLESVVDANANTISAEVTHFSIYHVIGVGVIMFVVGKIAGDFIAGSKKALLLPKYITPTAKNVQDYVKSGNFVVDMQNKRILLKNKQCRAVEKVTLRKIHKASEILENPEGECIEFGYLFGTLLIAAGYEARIVAGTATVDFLDKSGKLTKRVKGGHLWTEVLIDGRIYYVDTVNPHLGIFLVPIAEANQRFEISHGDMCGKTIKNKVISVQKYDPAWPLLGKWNVVRKNISPEVPREFKWLVDLFIDENATWEIVRGPVPGGDGELGNLEIKYGSRDTWYRNPFGLITKEKTIVNESDTGISCTFEGGSRFIRNSRVTIPGSRAMEKINVQLDELISVGISSEKKLSIKIQADAKGKYYGEGEATIVGGVEKRPWRWKNVDLDGSVTYEGIRKE